MPDEPALQTVTRGSERAGASHPGRTLSEVDEDQDEEEVGLEPPLERTTPSSRPALSELSAAHPAPSELGAGAPLGNEDLRAAVEQKRLEVANLRLRQELAALTAEAAGEAPEVPIPIEGTSLPIHKRGASTQLIGPPMKIPRIGSPKKFSGESLEELTGYADWWAIQWDHPDWAPFGWTHRIMTAATALEGRALTAWSARKRTPVVWKEFLDFQRDLIRAPANRTADAINGIWRYRQKDGQSATQVWTDLVRLRQEVPELTAEARRAWELLLALKPEVRLAVQAELPTIDNEGLILETAQRHEELLRTRREGKQKESYAAAVGKQTPSRSGAASTSSGRRSNPPAPAKQAGSKPKKATSDQPQPQGEGCFVCGELGHRARDCPQKATSKGSARVSADKGTEKQTPGKK